MSADARCPACTSPATKLFLTRLDVPVNQNTLFADERAARAVVRGDLRMTVCETCGFVFNAAFDESKLAYDQDYDNNQICSPVFHEYVDGLVSYLLDEKGLRDRRIVEVGCGKGYFLEKLIAADAGNRGIGFDPTYLGNLSDHGGRLHFEKRFYDEAAQDVTADAVICRHVIEHVPDPLAMMIAVRRALEKNRHAQVFFETPCAEWILRNRAVWDFFYEHCSLFTADSLVALFTRAGFEVTSIQHRFEGQYLWIEARPGSESITSVDASGIVALSAEYAAEERQRIAALRERVDALRAGGGVAIWGAGAKGVTFAHLIDAARERVECVVDLNPRKQLHFVPGTAHPIVDFHELPARGVRSALVMNPNYLDENRAFIARAGIDVALYTEES